MHGKIIEVVDGSDTCVLETMAGKFVMKFQQFHMK